jgi:hypothetical protein
MSIEQLFNTFANNLLPILLISAGAYLLGSLLHVDARSVGRVSFYFFSPVLVFNLLIHSKLPAGEIVCTGALAVSVMLVGGLAAWLAGTALKLERMALVSVVITSMFANNGNYGLPLISFAFGQEALAHSSIYFVFSALLVNTLGVLIASLGHLDFKQAFLGMFKVPTLYAVLLAWLIHEMEIILPVPLERTVSLVAGGGVPMMIVLLGLELRQARWTKNLAALGITSTVRLVLGAGLGFLFATLYGIEGSARQAGIVEASMPSAVATTNLAGEYKLDASLVAASVLVSTLLSPLTLTPLLVFLGS